MHFYFPYLEANLHSVSLRFYGRLRDKCGFTKMSTFHILDCYMEKVQAKETSISNSLIT